MEVVRGTPAVRTRVFPTGRRTRWGIAGRIVDGAAAGTAIGELVSDGSQFADAVHGIAERQ